MSQTKPVSKQIADLELAVYELDLKSKYKVLSKTGKTIARCGTISGYTTHVSRKQRVCDKCKQAANTYNGKRLIKKPVRPRPTCGTAGGYGAHYKRKETPCAPCKAAHVIVSREFRSSDHSADKNKEPLPCGTAAGFWRHGYKKETSCAPCRRAYLEYRRNLVPKTKRKPASCGTLAGYRAHLKDKQLPCKFCRATSRAYKKAWLANLQQDPVRAAQHKLLAVSNAGRRRARKRNLPSDNHTAADVLTMYGTLCYLCNKEIDLLAPRRVGEPGWEMGLHIEHLLPLSLGGSHTIDNVRPSHGLCNCQKGPAILDVALEELTNNLPT